MRDLGRIGLVAPLPPQIGGVASFAEWLLAHEKEIGARYETFDLWRPPEGGVGGRFTLRAALRQARLLVRFRRWLRDAPRIVHYCVSGTVTGLLRDVLFLVLLARRGSRTVAHVQVVPERGFARRLVRVVDRFVACWVGIAPASERLLADLGISSAWIANPVRVHPNGEVEAPANGPLRLLFVGRYGERKGCPELVAALSRARASGIEATLRFVGREEHEGEELLLRREVEAQRVAGQVEFAGVAPPARLAEHYSTADVICLPSRREGMPLALLEGMAFGLPALATPVGGIADFVVSGENGLLVEPGDVEGLADCIRRLASDAGLRRRLGEAARSRVEATAGDKELVRRWQQVYREARTS